MRNELIDLYNLAIADHTNKDIVKAYQQSKARIAPQIVMAEILENDALRLRAEQAEAENTELKQRIMLLHERAERNHKTIMSLGNKTAIIEARCKRLEEALKRGIELHENGDAGTCMCGDNMLHYPTDHTPVSMLEYYGDQWAEEARRALEEK